MSVHSIQWNSFGITKTPEDGRLRSKDVLKGRSDGNICNFDGIISCIKIYSMLGGSLSPRHGAASGYGWRRRPPGMEGSCE
jgi:hypothetical protein